MDNWDVDERGQRYDLILPKSSLKENSPGPGEYVWDTTYLGFSAWSDCATPLRNIGEKRKTSFVEMQRSIGS